MAERDTWPEDPNTQPTKGKSSGGGCGKVVLIIGGVGLVIMLLCCGVGGYMMYSFMPKISTTPAEVTEMTKKILEIKIPDDFVPETGMTMDNFAMTMRIATYKHKEDKGSLILGNLTIKMANAGGQKPDIAEKMNEGMKLQVGDTTVREFEVKGKKVPFRFSEATDQEKNRKVRMVEGDIDMPGGATFIKYVIDEELYDEDAVVEMIESIK